jgi:hypothetical protein
MPAAEKQITPKLDSLYMEYISSHTVYEDEESRGGLAQGMYSGSLMRCLLR